MARDLKGIAKLQSENVYLKRKIKGVKMQRADLKRRLSVLLAAAKKVVLVFPDDDDAHEFNVPAYIIDELRDLVLGEPKMATKTDWKFKDGAEPQGSSAGIWYDICEGYIKPAELLDDDTQITAIESSISTVADFIKAMSEAELLNEF